ncbi:hypothetical protein TRFO_15199 [Tritrichomonas foetus]|uniref:Conserved oligomeric Golgi complex subunit 6 n=1 Tax=Tritrichomonas foetus TaxID=1144522 RepID=A0A1J4KXJ0_9EUKA|nr:hypothetical protein TRFO_15199 [Tritrichomonas foetus]|eukprot:OHT14420.1 hypothetical protein TRFO_15199 [Tritrichomonas foetus]
MQTNIQRRLVEIEALANDTRPEVIEALSSIDSANISGNVRNSLEEKELATLNNFIKSFSNLSNAIGTIFKTIDTLDKSCDSMLEKLSIGDKGVDEVLDMTTSLHTQQEKQMHQLNKIHNFIDEFYLPKSDLEILNAGDINDTFFDAFTRLETVQERTTATLRTNQSTCLLDVSASLNKTKESAYQRMYHWLHMNSHLFDSLHPCVGSSYEKCLASIKVKPFHYGFVIDEIAKVRGDVVGRTFLRALTTGDKENKPIEASSGVDPLQFVGDMFAWIHQCTATEAAFLSNLLKEEQTSKNVKNALATVFDALIRPLEPRVQQAIKNLARPADFYQVANICAFFSQTFGDICGMTSSLYRCTETLKLSATEGFKKSISESVEDIRADGKPTQGAITEAIHAVAEITSLHKQSSLSASFDIGTLIDSYANGLKSAIEDCKDSVSFQTNALYELLLVCRDANLMSKTTIGEEVDNLLARIVIDDSNEIFVRCRIHETIAMCDMKTDQPMSTIRGLEPDILRHAINRYESSVLESKKIITPRCDSLSNPDLRQRAHKEVIEQLVTAYKKMYNVVMNPHNGYESPGTMFKHTPELFGELLM